MSHTSDNHTDFENRFRKAVMSHEISIDPAMSARVRNRVMDACTVQLALQAEQKQIAPVQRAALLERIMSKIPDRVSVWNSFVSLFRIQQRVGASVLLLAFVTSLLFTFDLPRTQAATDPVLRINKGTVTIIRLGQAQAATDTMSLQEGDIIATSIDSEATIVFPDESISRLSPSTNIEIMEVKVDPSNETATQIDLAVHEGKVWNKVATLVGKESSFEVSTKNLKAESTEPTTFVVGADDSNEYVLAVDNTISVQAADTNDVQLAEGYTAEVSSEEPAVAVTTSEKILQKDAKWVAQNLVHDAKYIETLQEQRGQNLSEEAGILPGDTLYPVKQLTEQAAVTLALSSYSKALKKLQVADTKLAEALVVLSREGVDDSMTLLSEYADLVSDAVATARSFDENDDTESAEELIASIQEKITRHLKQLIVFPHSSEVARIRGALLELQTVIVLDDVARAHAHLEYADHALAQVNAYIEIDNTDAAKEHLDEYSTSLTEAKRIAEGLDDAQQEVLSGVTDKHDSTYKVLDTLLADQEETPEEPTSSAEPVVVEAPEPTAPVEKPSQAATAAPLKTPVVIIEPGKDTGPQFPQLNLYFELEEGNE